MAKEPETCVLCQLPIVEKKVQTENGPAHKHCAERFKVKQK